MALAACATGPAQLAAPAGGERIEATVNLSERSETVLAQRAGLVEPGHLPFEPRDDGEITAALKLRLSSSTLAFGAEAAVRSHEGRVTLFGAAESSEARHFAERLARDTRGVLAVDNQLVVLLTRRGRGASDVQQADAAGQPPGDDWITGSVLSTLKHSRSVGGADIRVSTRAGVVMLAGRLSGAARRDAAIEFVRNLRGVERVDATALVD
nr:BON domain-containing protein [Lysobacter sp. CAU 1642]